MQHNTTQLEPKGNPGKRLFETPTSPSMLYSRYLKSNTKADQNAKPHGHMCIVLVVKQMIATFVPDHVRCSPFRELGGASPSLRMMHQLIGP